MRDCNKNFKKATALLLAGLLITTSVSPVLADDNLSSQIEESADSEKPITEEKELEELPESEAAENQDEPENIPDTAEDFGQDIMEQEKTALTMDHGTGKEESVSVKAGVTGKKIEEYTKKLMNKAVMKTLDVISQETEGSAMGSLLEKIVGSSTTTLLDIKNEIINTQIMVAHLQDTVNMFEAKTNAQLAEIKKKIDATDLDVLVQRLNEDAKTLDSLMADYKLIIDRCFDGNGNLKEELTDKDKAAIGLFVENVKSQKLDSLLTRIEGIAQPVVGNSVYTQQFNCVKNITSFRHKAYISMYDLFNLISSMRTTALSLYEEVIVYEQRKAAEAAGNADGFEPELSGFYEARYNPVIDDINIEAAAFEPYSEMTELFGKIDWDETLPDVENASEEEIREVLADCIDQSVITTIHTYDRDGNKIDEPGYEVISNRDNRSYLISGEAHTLSKCTSYWSDDSHYPIYYDHFTTTYGPGYTQDRRFVLPANEEELKGLFNNQETNQISWLKKELRSSGDLPDAKMLLTSQRISKQKGLTYCQELYLVDAANFSPGKSDAQYMKNGSGNIIDNEEVERGGLKYKFTGTTNEVEIKSASMLHIYVDNHISNFMDADADGVYRPTVVSALPLSFNLKDGDVLDLSRLSGGILDRTISVGDGAVKIIGGGSGHVYEKLRIEDRGAGTLTLENLYATNKANMELLTVHADGREIQIAGSCSLNMTGDYAAIASTANQTRIAGIDGGALALTGNSAKKALLTSSNALVIDQLTLSLQIKSDTAISIGSGSQILSSKITSDTSKDGLGEITITKGEIKDTELNLKWGSIKGEVQCENNRWTGNVKYGFRIKTGAIKDAGTDDRIDLTYSNGLKSHTHPDIGSVSGNQFEYGKLDEIYITSEAIDNIDKVTLTINGSDGWYVETVEVTSSVDGDITKLSGSVFHFYSWLDDSSSMSASRNDKTIRYRIKTADVSDAGSASNIFVSMRVKDSQGSSFTTEEMNVTSRQKDRTFSSGKEDEIIVPDRSGRDIKSVEGIYIRSDHSGSYAGWKLQSISAEYAGGTVTANGINQWYLDTNKTLIGATWENTGLTRMVISTADVSNAGTDAGIFIKIYGANGTTDEIKVNNYCDKRNYDPMERGALDNFSVAYSDQIGAIQKIEVRSDGSGSGSAWNCDYININQWGYQGSVRDYSFSVFGELKKGTYTYYPTTKVSANVGSTGMFDTNELRKLIQESGNQTLHISSPRGGNLSIDVLKLLETNGKTLVIERTDENNKVLYQWILQGENMGQFLNDIKTGLTISGQGLAEKYGIISDDGSIALEFEHSGSLPPGTKIRIAACEYGFKSGDTLSLYHYNKDTQKPELVIEDLLVGEDGFVTLSITHCSAYILTKAQQLVADNGQTNGENNTGGSQTADVRKVPKTGDDSSLLFFLMIGMGSLGVFAHQMKKRA